MKPVPQELSKERAKTLSSSQMCELCLCAISVTCIVLMIMSDIHHVLPIMYHKRGPENCGMQMQS